MKKKVLMKRLASVVLAAAVTVSQFSAFGVSNVYAEEIASEDAVSSVEASTGDKTLYVYYEGSEKLIMNIWNHTGIEFAEDDELSGDFGWDYKQAILKPVAGFENWYYVGLDIIDASIDDGFDIYEGNSSAGFAKYDSRWNNQTDYASLINDESSTIALKNATIFTDIKEVGLEIKEEVVYAKTADADITLYLYSEDSSELVMDIWNSAGIKFSADDTLSDYFGWNKDEAVLQAVEGYDNWYYVGIDLVDSAAHDGFDIYDGPNSKKVATYDDQWNNTGEYALLVSGESKTYAVKDNTLYSDVSEVGIKIKATQPADNTPTADVTVEKVEGLDDDFITGADISSYLSIINSGAKYYDKDGKLLDEQGFFDLLAAGGTNYARIRVWNDPYKTVENEDGTVTKYGYGGGNNDLEAAKIMGQYATNAGMKVLIDFHYSDLWADPSKQEAPKAWKNMTLTEKQEALYSYTKESLQYLLDNGVDVGMVQVGNETTSKFCGESNWEKICGLFSQGSNAVREVAQENEKDIQVAIHFTNPERSGNYDRLAGYLNTYGVDYDVFASSYYPYWHGTLSNLTSVLKSVANTYDKKVMVAETSWAYTLLDGDGHENTVRKNANDSNQPYDFSVQGQCTELREVANAVANIGDAGIGLFYWEAAWIPVQYAYNEDGTLNDEIYEANKLLWENYGSGWASSYGGEYDANDAGKWYGGSAVDNQAWFDFSGKALSSVNAYKYLREGVQGPKLFKDITVNDITVELADADSVTLPETVTAKFSDGTTEEYKAKWDTEAFNKAIAAGVGQYTIKGSAYIDEKNREFSITLTITTTNILVNGGFEDGLNGWDVSSGILNTNDAASNQRNGNGCMHFWTEVENDSATATQKITVPAGYYNLEGYVQGGDAGENDKFSIALTVDGKTYSAAGSVSSWKNWTKMETEKVYIPEEMEVTVTASISDLSSGVWGSFDDIKLYSTAVTAVEEVKTTVKQGAEVEVPETVKLYFNDDSTFLSLVSWDEEDIKATAKSSKAGVYAVEGTVLGTDKKATWTITVESNDKVLETGLNTNGDFETVTNPGNNNDVLEGWTFEKLKDNFGFLMVRYKNKISTKSGNYALLCGLNNGAAGKVGYNTGIAYQTVTDLEEGTYTYSGYFYDLSSGAYNARLFAYTYEGDEDTVGYENATVEKDIELESVYTLDSINVSVKKGETLVVGFFYEGTSSMGINADSFSLDKVELSDYQGMNFKVPSMGIVDEPEPTPVVTPEPTEVPTPVVTPEPTEVPTPVVTPEPTKVPTPVATPAPTAEPTAAVTPTVAEQTSPSVETEDKPVSKPELVTLKSVKSSKKKLVLKWKKVKNITGYQVQYSTSKKFTKKTTINVNKARNSYRISKNLKAGKTVYVRIRSYVKVNNSTTSKASVSYGSWSKVAKVKVSNK